MTQPSLLDIPESRSKKRGAVRRSSVLTYQAEQGRIGKRADFVRDAMRDYYAVTDFDCPTSAELASWIFVLDEPVTLEQLLTVRRGLSDLQASGVVERVPHGDRKCRISGRTCAVWRLKERG